MPKEFSADNEFRAHGLGNQAHRLRLALVQALLNLRGVWPGIAQAIEEPEKLVEMRKFEGIVNTLAYTYERDAITVPVVSDVHPGQRTDSCRVEIWHICEVKDQVVRPISPHFGLEVRQRGQN